MRKEWKQPLLEVLNVSMTMNGPGSAVPDCFDAGDESSMMNGNEGNGQDSSLSNASCLGS